KLNEEMMKLYKEHHVNPLGGCLPLLLQLPIFLALYQVLDACGKRKAHSKSCLSNYVGLGHIPKGTSLYQSLLHGHNHFLGINLGITPVAILHNGLTQALPAFVLVLLMIATTWYQQKQIMGVSSGQQADQMKLMGQIMPILLGVFSLELAAGISVYWVASNIWTVGQQAIVLKKPVGGPLPGDADGGKKPVPAGPKGGPPKGLAASGVSAGRPKGGAGEKAAAGKPGAKQPQGAGSGAKAGARPANGVKAAAGKSQGSAKNGSGSVSGGSKTGGGNAAAKGGQGVAKEGAGNGAGKGGGKPAAAAGGKGGQKLAVKAQAKGVTMPAPASPAGSGSGSGAGPSGVEEEAEMVPAGKTGPKNGARPAENGLPAADVAVAATGDGERSGTAASSGYDAGEEAEVTASGAPAVRPRPQRAQPGSSSGGGRKRRR
ncbi:MAG: YidC/Oxa1 family membrane protein insertase, partial [Actinomycetota bacterium]